MPYPKRYVDGVLLNWGDRLFYEPLHRNRAPRTSRVTWPGGAAQLRAQIARTLRRVPEVMVKITNRPGGKRGMKSIQGHLRYISRNGKVALEDQEGQMVGGAAEVKDLADEWRRGGLGIPEESRHREAFNIMLSMPPGTDRLAVHRAARDFAKAEFGENHRYVFAAHDDEAHPHVHLCVVARGYDGQRLNPRKADLQRWREGFAARLREHGVEANATPRRTRGVTRRYAKQAVVHLHERGATPAYESVDIGAAAMQASSFAERRTLEAWHEIGQALAGSDSGPDRRMAVQVADFVRNMPAVQGTPETRESPLQVKEPTPGVRVIRVRRRAATPPRPEEPDIER